MRAVICGAWANNRAELWLSRLVFLVHLGVRFWRCFRLRREQAIMKRSGGGLPRAAWAGQPSLLGERRGRARGDGGGDGNVERFWTAGAKNETVALDQPTCPA